MNLYWGNAAKIELTEAAVHYQPEEPGLEKSFVQKVEAAADRIVLDPLLAREFDPPYRKVITERFPYQLIYYIEDDTVWIVSVMHQSRRPGYWKEQ